MVPTHSTLRAIRSWFAISCFNLAGGHDPFAAFRPSPRSQQGLASCPGASHGLGIHRGPCRGQKAAEFWSRLAPFDSLQIFPRDLQIAGGFAISVSMNRGSPLPLLFEVPVRPSLVSRPAHAFQVVFSVGDTCLFQAVPESGLPEDLSITEGGGRFSRFDPIPWYKVYPGPMRIGELAGRAGVNVQTIRFYERRRLLREPERTPSGYRTYGQTDLEKVQFIKWSQQLGFTLKEARQLLHLRWTVAALAGSRVVHGSEELQSIIQMAEEKLTTIQEKIKSLQDMGKQLVSAIDKLRNQRAPVCPASKPRHK